MKSLGIRGVIFLLVCTMQPTRAQSPPKPKIHVYIIGIGEFKYLEDLNEPGLRDAITFECNDIESYFHDRFGTNVDIKKHCAAEETSREQIRKYLSIDLPNQGSDNLNFVFLMSHGTPVSYANQFLGTDVQIITYDTTQSDQELTSISAATELLPWLQKLSSRSTTILFLDVCYAGNAENLSTQLAGRLQEMFGIKNLVIASSLAKDKSYQAAFTAAVMSVLRSDECVPAQDLDRRIADTIKGLTAAKLNGSEGFPDVIVPYVGSLCLGNMGEDGKLLFVYTGQEPKTTQYRIVGASSNSIEGPSYIQNPFFTRRENSDKYTVYIKRVGEVEQIVRTLDLTTSDFDIAWIDEETTYVGAAEFLQNAASIAQLNGSSPDTAALMRLGASAIYRSNGDSNGYQRTLNSVSIKLRNRFISPEVFAAAFHDASVKKLLNARENEAGRIANQLALSGDFKNAALAARIATARETDRAAKEKAEQKEYLLWGASGNVKEAKSVRQRATADIEKIFPFIYLAEQRATKGAGSVKAAFQNLSALGVVAAVTKPQKAQDELEQ